MAIKYRLLEKGEPGVVGGGTKKWYASVATDGEVSIDGLVKSIEKFSALSEADMRGLYTAFENVFQEALQSSQLVGREKLRSLCTSRSSEAVSPNADLVARTHIKRTKVSCRPGKRLSDGLNNAGFRR